MIEYKGYTFNKDLTQLNSVKSGKYKKYLSECICLDTETSHNHDSENSECWVYQWCFSFNGGLYYGRTPFELCEKLKSIVDYYDLNKTKTKLLVYVHNLSYDYSYLLMALKKYFGNPKSILATSNHKVFMASYKCGLEFRCSYKLSNDSLDRWSKKLNTQHKKLVGSINYNIIRNQRDRLYKNDWKYMVYDVIVLDECIKAQLKLYNDNLASIPLTSTGYIRREILRKYKGQGHHYYLTKDMKAFKNTRLDYDTYIACRSEFSGGLTHGNRYYIDKHLHGNIAHYDFRSHYPSQQRVQKFPMSKLTLYSNDGNYEDLKKRSHKFMFLCECFITDGIVDKNCTLPYMQLSHVIKETTKGFKYLDDNGRVVCFKGTCRMWLEFREVELLKRQYTFGTFIIKKVYCSMLGYLPKYMTDTIDMFYKGKSDFKQKVKDLQKAHADIVYIINAELDLMKSKNGLNGIYGVSATDPIKQEIKLNGNEWSTIHNTKEDVIKKLDKFYDSPNSCMRYQWGIYTTIMARLELIELYELIESIPTHHEHGNFIYADTDSIFFFTNDEIEKAIEKWNQEKYQDAINMGAYITTESGKDIVYHQFEKEDEIITDFKFLHTKCYCYCTDDGEMHTTIAGVQKYKHGITNSQELKSIDNLTNGFVFSKCGGTTSKYVDCDIHTYNGNICCGGCIISNTTKTMKFKPQLYDDENIIIWNE